MGLKELIFGKQIKQAHAAQYRNSTQCWLPVLERKRWSFRMSCMG